MSSSANDVVGLLPHRACRNCVQIKVKCIPKEGASQTICQRCSRLNKQCTTAVPVARKRRRVASSRVTQLEDKINELSNLLTKPPSASNEDDERIPGSRLSQNSPNNTSPACNVRTDETVPYRIDDHEGEAQYTRKHSHITSTNIMAGYENSLLAPHHPLSPPATSEGQSTTNRDHDSPDISQSRNVVHSEKSFDREHLIEAAAGPVAEPYCGFICTKDNPSNGKPPTNTVGPFDGALSRREISSADFCPLFLDPKLEHDLFRTFRNSMSHFYPFVILDPAVSAQQLKCEKPFLFWACIIAASYHHRTLHRKLNEEMLKGIGEFILLKGAKSLDLLQGILVLVAWYHYYAHLNPQFMNLVYLAQALVVDLGYTKPSFSALRNHLAADADELWHGRKVNCGITTNEERRAFLGCYVLTSRVSQCFRRVDPMRYTKHMHDCYLELEKATEVQSDTYLLQIVRLQHMMGKYVRDELTPSKIPWRIHSQLFEDDVRQYEVGVPLALRNNPHILVEIASCKVCFYQPSQIDDFENPQERAEILHACLSEIDEFYKTFLSVPLHEFDKMTFSTWLGSLHSLTVLGQLSFMNVDGWNVRYVRTKLDLAGILQQLVDKFTAINAYHKEIIPDQIPWRYAVYAERMRRIRAWFEAKVNAELQNVNQTQAADADSPQLDAFNTSLFDVDFDDALWRDIMGDFTSS